MLLCVAYTEIQGAYLDGIYYEKTVPLAAIEWRTEGECVYELIERDTPLGTRIYLHRVNISVLETGSDQTFAAISAPVPSGTRVAIPTDAGLQDKQIVQIKDEENE